MTFCDIAIGQTFDCQPHPSFYEHCIKLGMRRYRGLATGTVYKIGKARAETFHVITRGEKS